MLIKRSNSSLNTKGGIGEKSCIMTIDTVVFMSARPNSLKDCPRKN